MLSQALREAVDRYCALGFYLIPVRSFWADASSHKKAVIPPTGWQLSATNDPVELETAYNDHGANGIAVVRRPSNVLAVDIDSAAGQELVDSWIPKGMRRPRTMTQRTGREGGVHLLYRVSGAVPSRAFPGLDVIAADRFLVLAPSIHPSGRSYETDWAPIVDAPYWLLDSARKPAAAQAEGRTYARAQGSADLPPHVQRALATDLVGHRSTALHVVETHLVRRGWSDEDIIDRILSSPVGDKARRKSEPKRWLADDLRRARRRASELDDYLDRVLQCSLERPDLFSPRSRSMDVVLVATLVRLARSNGTRVPVTPVRTISDVAGCHRDTAAVALHRLVTAGFLRQQEWAQGVRAASYELCVPVPTDGRLALGDAEDVLGGLHDIFTTHALGPGAARIYAMLHAPLTRDEVTARHRSQPRTCQTQLESLMEVGLIACADGRYSRTEMTLDQAARQINAPKVHDRRRLESQLQRRAHAQWIEEQVNRRRGSGRSPQLRERSGAIGSLCSATYGAS